MVIAVALGALVEYLLINSIRKSRDDSTLAPKMSLEVCGSTLEIGMALVEGPLLVQVRKDHIVAWETDAKGQLSVVCAGGTRYTGSGIDHERSKKIREALGFN